MKKSENWLQAATADAMRDRSGEGSVAPSPLAARDSEAFANAGMVSAIGGPRRDQPHRNMKISSIVPHIVAAIIVATVIIGALSSASRGLAQSQPVPGLSGIVPHNSPYALPPRIPGTMEPRSADRERAGRLLSVPVFAPGLGEPWPELAGKQPEIPDWLVSDDANEFYLVPLAMLEPKVAARLRSELERHRAKRRDAGRALIERIKAVSDADRARQRQELEAFAREQDALLAELEREAESLRAAAAAGSEGVRGVSWRAGGLLARQKTILSALFAAHFQIGLGVEGRELLLELALKLSREEGGRGGLERSVSLSPWPACIARPGLSEPKSAVHERIYKEAREAMLNAVSAELERIDQMKRPEDREAAWMRWSSAVVTELARLESIAEPVRDAVADEWAAHREVGLASPLVDQLAAYNAERAAWQRALVQQMRRLRSEFPQDDVSLARVDEAPAVKLETKRSLRGAAAERWSQVQQDLAKFNAAERNRFDRVMRNQAAIQQALRDAVPPSSPEVPAERKLAEFESAVADLMLRDRYADYARAVLTPGLSPRQRRLLMGPALEKLGVWWAQL